MLYQCINLFYLLLIVCRPWGQIGQFRCEPPLAMLGKEAEVVMDDMSLATTPTHYLALYPSKTFRRTRGRRKIIIIPCQGYVLPVYCRNVRHLPPVKRVLEYIHNYYIDPEGAGPGGMIHLHAMRLPLLPLALPDPSTFAMILQFFHQSVIRQFALNLVPYLHAGAPPGLNFLDTAEWKGAAMSELAHRYTPPRLRLIIERLWSVAWNMVALGVSHDIMWRVLRAQWELVQGARQLQEDLGWVPPPEVQRQPPRPGFNLGMCEVEHTPNVEVTPPTVSIGG